MQGGKSRAAAWQLSVESAACRPSLTWWVGGGAGAASAVRASEPRLNRHSRADPELNTESTECVVRQGHSSVTSAQC